MGEAINVGSLVADLDLDTSKLDRATMNAENALFLLRNQIKAVQDAFASGSITVQKYADDISYLREAENALIGAMNASTAASRSSAAGSSAATAAFSQLQHQTKAAGQALMSFGYIIDDIQYGFGSVVNNIGPFIQQISVAAGASTAAGNAIGAASQVIAVAGYQSWLHWDKLMKTLGVGIPNEAEVGLKSLQAELKATEAAIEKASKVGWFTDLSGKADFDKDVKRAATLKEEIDTHNQVEAITGAQSKDERERGSSFKEAVAESGGQAALDELRDALEAKADKEGVTLDADTIRNMAKAKGFTLTEDEAKKGAAEKVMKWWSGEGNKTELTPAQIQDLQKKKFLIDPETGDPISPEKMANKEFARSGKGDKDARDRILDAIDPKGNLQSPFARAIDATSPERKAEAKEKERFEKNAKERDDIDKANLKEGERIDQERFDDDIKRTKDARINREKKRKEVVKNAREDSPGIDKYAQNLAAGAMAGDISPEEAMAQIRGVLKANDKEYKTNMEAAKKTKDTADDKDVEDRANKRADFAANEIMKDAAGETKKKVIEEAMKEPEQQKVTHSEQFNAMDLASKVQAGVSNENESKKQTSYLDQAVKYLAEIAKANGGNNPWAGFEEV